MLEIKGLTTTFSTKSRSFNAIEDVNLTMRQGEVVGIVGESGSGKSITALTVMGLLPRPMASVTAGSVRYLGQDLVGLPERRMRPMRGPEIAMIFQEPMTSLNPAFTIGDQLMETLRAHERLPAAELLRRTIAMLDRVGIPSAAHRLNDYPHQLSGGQRQRVMIAMALICNPKLLIADEPTTALDVTIQQQILELLMQMRDELGMGIIIITHNMGVVAEVADRVMVMYSGRIVEQGPVTAIFDRAAHPYTRGLLDCIPRIDAQVKRLYAIPGALPDPQRRPHGCCFNPRCEKRIPPCMTAKPRVETLAADHQVACIRAKEPV